MSRAVTLPALQLIRRTCEEVGRTLEGGSRLSLERAGILLARLIVEARVGEEAAADGGDDPVAADLAYWQAFDAEMRAELARSDAGGAEAPEEPPFDAPALEAFLRGAFPDEGEVTVTHAQVASRGFSKKTMLVSLEGNRRLPAELALRIDQPFNYLGTTVTDEYPVIRHLWTHGVRLPEPLALESSGAVLGQPFIVSPRVRGALVGSNFDPPPRDAALIADVAACMAGLHAVPLEPATAEAARARPHLDVEIARSWDDYRATGIASPLIDAAFGWVRSHRALGSGPLCYVHNDFNLNNILVDEGRVQAVVDWEFVHVGTAAADLAYFHYSAEAGSSFDRFLADYAAAGGTLPSRETLDFYLLWGQVRLAVMGLQVEAGFRQGKFDDIRFGLAGALYLRQSMLRVGRKLVELRGPAG